METAKKTNPLIDQARNANLADYFSHGFSCKRNGNELYIKEVPGLCINTATNQWYNHYTGKGGSNAVNCLTENLGRDFKTAVKELTNEDLKPTYTYGQNHADVATPKVKEPNIVMPQKNGDLILKQQIMTAINKTNPPPEPTPAQKIKTQNDFALPEHADNMRRVFAYLCQTRKIPFEIVSELAKQGLLYQSQQEISYKINGIEQKSMASNAVFVHKSPNGEVVGGEVQGITTNKRYKGIVAGTTDSCFCFTPVPSKNCETKKAYVFESAIDLMSFYYFCDKNKLDGVMFVSMAGLKPEFPKQLQAQGVQIFSCVDNDEAGQKFTTENNFKALGAMLKNENVKDWNELLQQRVSGKQIVNNPEQAEKKTMQSMGSRK